MSATSFQRARRLAAEQAAKEAEVSASESAPQPGIQDEDPTHPIDPQSETEEQQPPEPDTQDEEPTVPFDLTKTEQQPPEPELKQRRSKK